MSLGFSVYDNIGYQVEYSFGSVSIQFNTRVQMSHSSTSVVPLSSLESRFRSGIGLRVHWKVPTCGRDPSGRVGTETH